MGVTRRVTGERPRIDVDADAAAIAARLPAVIRERVAAGLDIFDRPFAPYDRDYAVVAGARVDLDGGAPGGLLSTLRVTVRRTADGVVVITVAPDAAHMKVGTFLHNGTPTMKPRPWLGLSPRDLVVLERMRRRT
jgi:hypothetical protein